MIENYTKYTSRLFQHYPAISNAQEAKLCTGVRFPRVANYAFVGSGVLVRSLDGAAPSFRGGFLACLLCSRR